MDIRLSRANWAVLPLSTRSLIDAFWSGASPVTSLWDQFYATSVPNWASCNRL